MSRWEKAEHKLSLRERRYITDQLTKEKRSEELETMEEVFDKSTLMIVYRLLNSGALARIHGVVRAGKESRIYWAKGPDRKDVAVKIFLTSSAEFRKGMLTYIEGDPRFGRIRRDTRSLIYLWARKEYKNLSLCWRAKIKVPRPILVEGNVLLMQFIGRDGEPAPLLKETLLKDYQRFYGRLIDAISKLYTEANLVHGDLSEYNVMVSRKGPVLIDLSQAVHIEHPQASEFFLRDVTNVNRYFNRIVRLVPPEELLEKVKGEVGRNKPGRS